MWTCVFVFSILGLLCWWLSRFLGKVSRNLREATEAESYYKTTVLENIIAIKEGVDPTPEPTDLIAEISKVNKELTNKERQRIEDQKAINDLIENS